MSQGYKLVNSDGVEFARLLRMTRQQRCNLLYTKRVRLGVTYSTMVDLVGGPVSHEPYLSRALELLEIWEESGHGKE